MAHASRRLRRGLGRRWTEDVGAKIVPRYAGDALDVEHALDWHSVFFPPHDGGLMCAKLNSQRFQRQRIFLSIAGER